jgi:hypothetical protein
LQGFYIPIASKNHPPRNKQHITNSSLIHRLYLCDSLVFAPRIMAAMWFGKFGDISVKQIRRIASDVVAPTSSLLCGFPRTREHKS